MIFLDLRPGVTFPLLLAGTLTLPDNRQDEWRRAVLDLNAGGEKGTVLTGLIRNACRQPSVEKLISALHSSCRAVDPLTHREAADAFPEHALPGGQAVTSDTPDFLDPFEFSAYILLTISLRLHENRVKLLIPRIGSDSREQVFTILKDSGMLISPAAPAVSPFLAAVLAGHFTPFAGTTPPTGWKKTAVIQDPLDPAGSARAFVFADRPPEAETVTVIQANIDDMTPELLAGAVRTLLDRGALDVVVMPVLMKKGRPGYQVEVLSRTEDRRKLEELLLLETTTFGVRTFDCARRILERRLEEFESSFGRIRVKSGYLNGECLRSVPEYEDVAALSEKIGIPLQRLYTDIQNEIARRATP